MVDPNTWRFKLREGVIFQDGTTLAAEDVVFSVDRARADTSDLADSLKAITAVRAVDANTIEIATGSPALSLPVLIGDVAIMSKSWAERHGVTAATVYNRDQGTYARDHANGTGPFMLAAPVPGQRALLVRNPVGLEQSAWQRRPGRVVPDPRSRSAAGGAH
jgi:peptide/nickel transport system substrate-binding protein